MNIFLRDLKAHRKSLIIWCIGVVFMVVSGMGKYGGLSTSGQSLNELMREMPKGLQAIFGISNLDLSTVMGYYGILFLYVAIMSTIHAVMLGANIIAKEERDKTAEFLFSKPVSRKKVVTSKLLAALVQVILLNMAAFSSSVLIVGRYASGAGINKDIATLMAGLFIMQLIFLAIGAAIASTNKNAKKAGATSTGILLAMFLLSVAIDMNEKIEGLKYFTPFKYYEAKNLLFGGHFDTTFILLSIGIIIGLTAITYICYQKRDLK